MNGQPRRWAALRVVLGFALLAIAVGCCTFVATAQRPPSPAPLAIVDENVPEMNAGIDVRIPLHATGGVPPYQWSVVSGELPPGLSVDPNGFLIGRPAKPGSYSVVLAVTDSAQPASTIRKELKTQVTAALLLEWLRPPQVHGMQIDGVAEVSNGSKDDFDLTVIIVAVNETGRATALGYQHVTLATGVTNYQVPFGSTLPAGTYLVHADAIAEIPSKNTILRQHLQTPTALQIAQEP